MKLQLTVPDMACDACVKSITAAVQTVDQSATVEADTKTKQVDIETTADESAIRAAITQAGYSPAA
ncbi:MAG: heavy-metal-associated domain-containing protein [Cyanobacteria bacterium J06628_6]